MQPDAPIHFGTGGWRGILGQEVTFPRACAAVRGAASWLAHQSGERRVLVGHDSRSASRALAAQGAALLGSEGLEAILCDAPVPTPAITWALRQERVAGALVFTASHNPPEYHGLKVFGRWGGSVSGGEARAIEQAAAVALREARPPPPPGEIAGRDMISPYREALAGRLDAVAIARAAPTIVYDAMHGVGAGVTDRLLEGLGARVQGLRLESDPHFGGGAPDPRPERLSELSRQLRRLGSASLGLGLATDGDADRLVAVAASGRVLSETQTIALLVDHLALTGRLTGAIAVSAVTGSLVGRVAEHHGLRVLRCAMGFAELSRVLERGEAEVAGDESGGFAWQTLGVGKDGILGALLLAERVAVRGIGLDADLEALEARFGSAACGRRAVAATGGRRARLEKLTNQPPERLADQRVREACTRDGLRLEFDDGFLMLRASETEPVLRLYAEAAEGDRLQQRLEAGEALLRDS